MTQINSPKYKLTRIKATFNSIDKLNMTRSAMQGQYEIAFSDQDVVDAIQSLTTANFYKSMAPLNAKFLAWQDVYKLTYKEVSLYIKFQIDHRGEIIISFKRK